MLDEPVQPLADRHDALLRRLTDRFSVDVELQLEVQQELRTHLADSEAAFLASGDDPAIAANNAARSLGGEDELAEQLWQANRRRLSIRGIIRWVLRLSLIPAAGVVVVLILLGVAGKLGDKPPRTREQQLLLDKRGPYDLENAKALHELAPQDPVYLANYMSIRSHRDAYFEGDDEAALSEWLAFLEYAKQQDPDNGMYNLWAAMALATHAGELDEKAGPAVMLPDPSSETGSKEIVLKRFTLKDPEAFDKAVEEVRESFTKPVVTWHILALLERLHEAFGQPERLIDVLKRMAVDMSLINPPMNTCRDLVKAFCGRAIELAQAGRVEEAMELLDLARGMSLRVADQAGFLIEILVATACADTVDAATVEIARITDQPDLGKTARERYVHRRTMIREARTAKFTPEQKEGAGLLWSVMLPSMMAVLPEFGPTRKAEKAVASQYALYYMLVVILAVTVFQALGVLWSFLWRRGERRALLVWVGWKRIGKICFWAILVPFGMYFVYAHGLTASRERYGLNVIGPAVVVEYLLLGAIMLAGLMIQIRRAIRDRAEELGLAVPPRVTWRQRPLLTALAGLMVVVLAGFLTMYWITGPQNITNLMYVLYPSLGPATGEHEAEPYISVLEVALLAIYLSFVWWAFCEWFRLFRSKQYDRFRLTLRRSRVPILAAAIIVFGACFGATLAHHERSAVDRMRGEAIYNFREELERSTYKPLQDSMREECRYFLKSYKYAE